MIRALEETKLPVTSVDAPSSWDIEEGPPESGLGSAFMPATLVSLTAPKPLVKHFTGRHFVGGRYVPSSCEDSLLLADIIVSRFVPPSIARKYDFEVPEYQGIDQVVEVPAPSQKL